MPRLAPDQLLEELTPVDDLLIVQDLDGVCMQLVKDPLTRRMDPGYVNAAADLRGSFVVLTNGEHEGRRGVNRLVEAALGDQIKPEQAGLYLPGLAAGGVQFQDRFGHLSHPGVSDAEMAFLAAAPLRMEQLLLDYFPGATEALVYNHDVFDKHYTGDRTENQDDKNPGVNANYANLVHNDLNDNSGRVRCRELLLKNLRNFGRTVNYTEAEVDELLSRLTSMATSCQMVPRV